MSPRNMTPGTLNSPIYKGAQYQHTLTIYVKGTNTPVDLTGLNPFTFTVSHPNRDEALITVTATHTDLANGEVTITIPPESTDLLALGSARIGLRDFLGNPYVQSTVPVLFFSPPPP